MGPRRIGQLVHSLVPLPSDWVRVRIAYCGLCGSDLSKYAGLRAVTYPLSLGHEWVGVVVALGSDVRRVALDDVVTTDLNYRCGSCAQCECGRSHLCVEGQQGRFTNRGFAALVDIHVGYLQRCRSGPAPHLALAEPLSCAMHALAHVRPGPNDRVLVIGAGGLGLCTTFALWSNRIGVAFEVTDLDPSRLARLGSAIAPLGRAVSEPAGDYDVVVDVSGTVTGLRVACEVVRPGGRLCTMSHLPDHADVRFLPTLLEAKDVTLTMSYLNGPATTLTEAIRLLEGNWTANWGQLLEVKPLNDLPSVFAERNRSIANKAVIDVTGVLPHE
ncbi:MAG: zinc-dependent alcohol dehydrogenase [Dermatophilaceae bacterium]